MLDWLSSIQFLFIFIKQLDTKCQKLNLNVDKTVFTSNAATMPSPTALFMMPPFLNVMLLRIS